MINVSSSIKSLSLSLVFFSFLFFFEWLYLAATTQLTDEWPYFEGLWGAAPLLVTGIVGLTTACGDTPCRRILLLVTSILTLPILGGLIILLLGYLFASDTSDSGCQHNYIW